MFCNAVIAFVYPYGFTSCKNSTNSLHHVLPPSKMRHCNSNSVYVTPDHFTHDGELTAFKIALVWVGVGITWAIFSCVLLFDPTNIRKFFNPATLTPNFFLAQRVFPEVRAQLVKRNGISGGIQRMVVGIHGHI